MLTTESRGGRPTSWTLLVAVVLGTLVLAAPASAGQRQDANISQSCNAGDSDSGSDGEASGSDGGASSGGNCGNQRRVVQQSGGGDVSRRIRQRQSFGDDDRVRVRRDRDRDDDADDVEQTQVSASEASAECDDFSSQADAQAALDDEPGDNSDLDGDGDGRACEEEFTQEVSGAPEGGVETGGGGTLARAQSSSTPFADLARIVGPPLALALVLGGLLGLRRGRSA